MFMKKYRQLMDEKDAQLSHYKQLVDKYREDSNLYQARLYHAMICNRQQTKGLQRQARKIRRLNDQAKIYGLWPNNWSGTSIRKVDIKPTDESCHKGSPT